MSIQSIYINEITPNSNQKLTYEEVMCFRDYPRCFVDLILYLYLFRKRLHSLLNITSLVAD